MEKLYTIPEAAKRLQCSTHTIRRRINSRELQCLRNGRIILITETQLNAFLQGNPVPITDENNMNSMTEKEMRMSTSRIAEQIQVVYSNAFNELKQSMQNWYSWDVVKIHIPACEQAWTVLQQMNKIQKEMIDARGIEPVKNLYQKALAIQDKLNEIQAMLEEFQVDP